MCFQVRCRVKRSRVCRTSTFPCSSSKATAIVWCVHRWWAPSQARSQNSFETSFAGTRNSFILKTSGYWRAGRRHSVSRFPSWARCCFAMPHHETTPRYLRVLRLKTASYRSLKESTCLWSSAAVCGHTHMQFDRTVGRIRVVNAGSVGMPFQEPGAYWLLLGPNVQLRHTPYDLSKAAERIRDTKYPQAQDFAARNVLQSPSEGETLEAFTRVELQ